MNITDSKIWVNFRNNKFFNFFYDNTLGRIIKSYRLKDRKKDMKENGLKYIFIIDKELTSANIIHFADMGTLLGFVRDGRPISWDFDIDFGVFLEDKEGWCTLESVMNNIGFHLYHQFLYNDRVTEQTYCKGLTMVDFFNHYNIDGKTICYGYYHKRGYEYSDKNTMHMRIFRAPLITGTRKIHVDGGDITVPDNADLYLEAEYGSNWKIPDPKWTDGKGPGTSDMPDEFGYIDRVEK